ncbi:carbohydrate ABC transporter permease [Planotetraspora kaengkrachanensis]|uniref:Spermidine/putrescine ABC transporter permease n=1 Tax=Planotetraspora kaengkrachanensis TaxID=575193 RepID=A0A8J3LYB4_9ACTN|nr:sugar ABC transporter permease [Planotetraspora kaengkrachanensis]GIG78980.1 spermidine/putrescine ABC transporter permease [Planotetraspora kaengkrachanensis]
MSDIVQSLEGVLERLHIDVGLRPILSFVILLAAVFAVVYAALWGAVRARWITRNTAAFWVFVSPWIVGFLVFTGGPMVYSLVLSFTDWNLIDPAKFVGIANYREAFSDPDLGQALKVTLTYAVVSVPLQTVLSLAVALLMNIKVRGIHVFRTIWYLPSLVTGVAQAVLFIWVFNPGYGLANGLLRVFGIEGPKWLFDAHWALPTVIIMSLWTVGGNMIIYLAGLQDISKELYEAAEIDGANRWRSLWNITIPQVSPVIFFNVVTGLIYAMQTFTQGYVVTHNGGGPADSLLFYVLYLYNNAFSFFRMGYASALAWIFFIMIMVLTAVVFRGSAFWVYYESQRPKERRRRVHVG